MVSKAREDFPEPLSPVITVRLLRGISTSMFLRLCWRAPCTVIRSNIVWVTDGKMSLYCGAPCTDVQTRINYSCNAKVSELRKSHAARPSDPDGAGALPRHLILQGLPDRGHFTARASAAH